MYWERNNGDIRDILGNNRPPVRAKAKAKARAKARPDPFVSTPGRFDESEHSAAEFSDHSSEIAPGSDNTDSIVGSGDFHDGDPIPEVVDAPDANDPFGPGFDPAAFLSPGASHARLGADMMDLD